MPADLNQPSSPTIDTFELARSRQHIDGEIAVARLPRLNEFLHDSDGVLRYRIDGLVDEQGHPGAALHLDGKLHLLCQRCNDPLEFDLERTACFRFVATEEELNSLPIEDDGIDAVIGSHTMGLYDWIEDEVILSLPLVPRHAECSPPLTPDADGDARPNPFALLAAQKILNGEK